MKSRGLTAALAILVGALLAAECTAQGFPSRPIHFVVPYGAGGIPDVIARVTAQELGGKGGWRVVVDNRPGAGGLIAAELVAKAAADGYSLFVADIGHLAINPSLYPKLPYDPIRDFAPVTLATVSPNFLAVSASLPIYSVKDLIAYARANPGLPYGSSGNGSFHHFGMELFKLLTGVSMTHVPYKGVAQSVPAVAANDVAAVLAALPGLSPHVKTGRVRILANARAIRTPLMPDMPTVAESGVPGYEVDTGVGFLVPAGTPMEVVAVLNGEIVKVLRTPEVIQHFAVMGIEPLGSSPEQFAETIRAWNQKYRKLVKDVGMKVD